MISKFILVRAKCIKVKLSLFYILKVIQNHNYLFFLRHYISDSLFFSFNFKDINYIFFNLLESREYHRLKTAISTLTILH